jgi:cytochrome c peroxidase
MKKIKIILLVLAACLVISNIVVSAGDNGHKTTPYPLQLPDFVTTYYGNMPVPPDNPTTEEGVALGRKLFYDSRLSRNNTMNCGTCHRQGHGFSDFRQFSIGLDNQVGIRNAPGLANVGFTPQLFWDGRAASLELQARDPITNPIEMDSRWDTIVARLTSDSLYPVLFYKAFGSTLIDSAHILKAIAQFERTFIAFNTKYDAFYFEGKIDTFSDQELKGLDIFLGKGFCNHCHSDVLLTDNFFRNNGLDAQPDSGLAKITYKKEDIGKFKVPSLRNVAVTAPYMHDGRFATLAEVIDFYSDSVHPFSPNIDTHMEPFGYGLHLTETEKEALITFLKTLTDSSFLKNPAYKKPD